MPDYYFERECRTPTSEAYIILRDERPTGKVDLHFTLSVVHATLCVAESLTEEEIKIVEGQRANEKQDHTNILKDRIG